MADPALAKDEAAQSGLRTSEGKLALAGVAGPLVALGIAAVSELMGGEIFSRQHVAVQAAVIVTLGAVAIIAIASYTWSRTRCKEARLHAAAVTASSAEKLELAKAQARANRNYAFALEEKAARERVQGELAAAQERVAYFESLIRQQASQPAPQASPQ